MHNNDIIPRLDDTHYMYIRTYIESMVTHVTSTWPSRPDYWNIVTLFDSDESRETEITRVIEISLGMINE